MPHLPWNSSTATLCAVEKGHHIPMHHKNGKGCRIMVTTVIKLKDAQAYSLAFFKQRLSSNLCHPSVREIVLPQGALQ